MYVCVHMCVCGGGYVYTCSQAHRGQKINFGWLSPLSFVLIFETRSLSELTGHEFGKTFCSMSPRNSPTCLCIRGTGITNTPACPAFHVHPEGSDSSPHVYAALSRLSPVPSPSKFPLFNVSFLCVQLKAKIFHSWVILCLPNQLLSPLLPHPPPPRVSVIVKAPLLQTVLPQLAVRCCCDFLHHSCFHGRPWHLPLCSRDQDLLPGTLLQFQLTALKAWSWQNICSLTLSVCTRASSDRFPAGQNAAHTAGGWAPAGCITLDFLKFSISTFLLVLGEFHAVP